MLQHVGACRQETTISPVYLEPQAAGSEERLALVGNEDAWPDPERLRELNDVHESDVLLAALNVADAGPVQ